MEDDIRELSEIQQRFKTFNVSMRDDKYWPNFEFIRIALERNLYIFADFVYKYPKWTINIKKSPRKDAINMWIISLVRK